MSIYDISHVNGTNIIVKRDQLKNLKSYAGTLLHETAHALSGASDVSREFELELTNLLGKESLILHKMDGINEGFSG